MQPIRFIALLKDTYDLQTGANLLDQFNYT